VRRTAAGAPPPRGARAMRGSAALRASGGADAEAPRRAQGWQAKLGGPRGAPGAPQERPEFGAELDVRLDADPAARDQEPPPAGGAGAQGGRCAGPCARRLANLRVESGGPDPAENPDSRPAAAAQAAAVAHPGPMAA